MSTTSTKSSSRRAGSESMSRTDAQASPRATQKKAGKSASSPLTSTKVPELTALRLMQEPQSSLSTLESQSHARRFAYALASCLLPVDSDCGSIRAALKDVAIKHADLPQPLSREVYAEGEKLIIRKELPAMSGIVLVGPVNVRKVSSGPLMLIERLGDRFSVSQISLNGQGVPVFVPKKGVDELTLSVGDSLHFFRAQTQRRSSVSVGASHDREKEEYSTRGDQKQDRKSRDSGSHDNGSRDSPLPASSSGSSTIERHASLVASSSESPSRQFPSDMWSLCNFLANALKNPDNEIADLLDFIVKEASTENADQSFVDLSKLGGENRIHTVDKPAELDERVGKAMAERAPYAIVRASPDDSGIRNVILVPKMKESSTPVRPFGYNISSHTGVNEFPRLKNISLHTGDNFLLFGTPPPLRVQSDETE